MMEIKSEWEIECLKPSITVTGISGDTTTTIDGDGYVSISLINGVLGVAPSVAYEAISDMTDNVDTLIKVWEMENVIASDLMHMVDIGPIGYGQWQWHLECSEEGLSWHLDLRPNDHASLVISIYLYADLDPDGAHGRVMPDVDRCISIEVRNGINYVATLYSIPVPKKRGPITMGMLKEYLQGGHLNLQLLCDYMGMQLVPHVPCTTGLTPTTKD